MFNKNPFPQHSWNWTTDKQLVISVGYSVNFNLFSCKSILYRWVKELKSVPSFAARTVQTRACPLAGLNTNTNNCSNSKLHAAYDQQTSVFRRLRYIISSLHTNDRLLENANAYQEHNRHLRCCIPNLNRPFWSNHLLICCNVSGSTLCKANIIWVR